MDTSEFHPFRSAQARDEYLAYYDQRAQAWPVASETRLVDTSFGQTFVRISGPSDASPLGLLPASVFNSLMWIPNIECWSQRYRTYAVDNIYDCGRSIYTRALKSPDDFVQWLDELFTSLELGNGINLVGLSYGSWLTHQYALRFPQRLRKIVMLAHPAIVPPHAEFVFRLLLSFVAPSRFRSFVYWLLQDTAQKEEASRTFVDGTFGDMQRAATCFKPKATVTPKTMTDQELQNLRVPALLLVGENEKTFPPQKAIQRLNAIAPQIKTEIVPQAGHDLNSAQADLVNKKVLEFLR